MPLTGISQVNTAIAASLETLKHNAPVCLEEIPNQGF
jgi:hypothetical protein